jgi:hypothetical protein
VLSGQYGFSNGNSARANPPFPERATCIAQR